MVFVSGQLPIDAATDGGGSAEAQSPPVVGECKNILEEAGLSMANIVKTTVFLADMSLFADMDKVCHLIFWETPARSAVAVRRFRKTRLVEIECIAVR